MAVGFGPGDTIHHFSRTNSPRISIVLLPAAEKCWGARGVGVSRGRFLMAHAATDPSRPCPSIAASLRRPADATLSRGLAGGPTGAPSAAGLSPPAACCATIPDRRDAPGRAVATRRHRHAAFYTPIIEVGPQKVLFFSRIFSRGPRRRSRGWAPPVASPLHSACAQGLASLLEKTRGITMCWLGSRGRDPDTAPLATRRRD
jgi:hypothetical protein